MLNPSLTIMVLDAVGAERERQARLLSEGRIAFDCADPDTHTLVKLPVLLEEVGEVARELQQPQPNRRHLYEELVQVAAVAVAMAEAVMLREGIDATLSEIHRAEDTCALA